MSKIKKIEISDFRIFEGKVDFNFEGDNGISNLVALYAPNGFGKTSFFDAFEWCFSNKIKRFENAIIKKAIKDEEKDTILLTNTNSYDAGLEGKIKITTAENLFIERAVKKRKKPNTSFYNDYKVGLLSDESITTVLSKIPENNILTQDQIDAFLRSKTPEKKFEELKEFWPKSEEAINRLKKLSDLYKFVIKSKNYNISKKEECKVDLDKLKKDNKNIAQINIWLKKLKKQK